MTLYDLLVSGSCHGVIYKDLILLDYEISKYSYNFSNLDSFIFENLQQKFIHPTLKCNFKFIFNVGGIDKVVFFQTYNTFTQSNINSIRIAGFQYFNYCDFVIDQNFNFYRRKNLFLRDINNIDSISKVFNLRMLNDCFINSLKDMLLKNRQNLNTQIIYCDNINIRINPYKWVNYIIHKK